MMQRILVVDDEEDLREILRFNLETEGFEVETAASAEEALAKFSILNSQFSTAFSQLLKLTPFFCILR